jgi:hypothetical protein
MYIYRARLASSHEFSFQAHTLLNTNLQLYLMPSLFHPLSDELLRFWERHYGCCADIGAVAGT